MKKFLIAFLIVFPIMYIVSGISGSCIADDDKLEKAYFKDKEIALFGFIEKHFLGESGEILTNLLPSGEGHDTLSESIGLLMDYCVLRDKKDLFDIEFSFLKKNMLTNNYYVKWKYGNTDATCNAAIDDLRIIRALMDAHDKWGDKAYLDTAGFIQEGIYNNQVVNHDLCELYDWKKNTIENRIPLCYLDLYTMYRMSGFNAGWSEVAEKGTDIIEKGSFGSGKPLFKKYFGYSNGAYSVDEEYKQSGGICMIYTLYTAIHMAEMNEDTEAFTEWLKGEMDKGTLYAWYNPNTLKPSQKMESTAVYALAAVYSKRTGEKELFNNLLDKMLQFMVADKNSDYYGGLGNEEGGGFYSFDNLTALWALSLAQEN